MLGVFTRVQWGWGPCPKIRPSMVPDSAVRFCKYPLEKPASKFFHAPISSTEVIRATHSVSYEDSYEEFLMKIPFMAMCVCFRKHFVLLQCVIFVLYYCFCYNIIQLFYYGLYFFILRFYPPYFYDCRNNRIKGKISALWKLCFSCSVLGHTSFPSNSTHRSPSSSLQTRGTQ